MSSGGIWYLTKVGDVSRTEEDQNIMQQKLSHFEDWNKREVIRSDTVKCSVRKSEKLLMKSSVISWGSVSLKQSGR